MNYNTQNAKIASITEKSLIVGIDVGSETHYARAFDWRNYEYSKKPFAFNNDEAGFAAFKAWMEDMADKHGKEAVKANGFLDRKSTRLNSSHSGESRMPSSA